MKIVLSKCTGNKRKMIGTWRQQRTECMDQIPIILSWDQRFPVLSPQGCRWIAFEHMSISSTGRIKRNSFMKMHAKATPANLVGLFFDEMLLSYKLYLPSVRSWKWLNPKLNNKLERALDCTSPTLCLFQRSTSDPTQLNLKLKFKLKLNFAHTEP